MDNSVTNPSFLEKRRAKVDMIIVMITVNGQSLLEFINRLTGSSQTVKIKSKIVMQSGVFGIVAQPEMVFFDCFLSLSGTIQGFLLGGKHGNRIWRVLEQALAAGYFGVAIGVPRRDMRLQSP